MERILNRLVLCLGVFLFLAASGWTQTAAPASVTDAAQSTASLPTIDQIVERATVAAGGKAAWSNVTSMYMRGSVEVPSAQVAGAFESYTKAPNKTYQSVTLGDVVVLRQGYDGTNAWKAAAGKPAEDLQGEELEVAKLDADFYSEVNLKQQYPQMVLRGEYLMGGRSCYKVFATPLHGKSRYLYFDKETGLRIGMSEDSIVEGTTTRSEIYFADFKTVEGIQVPYTIHFANHDFTMIFHLRDVKTNIPILNSTFLKPAGKTNYASPAPSGSASVPHQPDTVAGGVSGSTYTNGVFGFTYTFPAGWTAHGDATNKEIMRVGKELMAGDDPGRKASFDASMNRTSQLLTVFQYPVGTPAKFNPSIQILAERVDFAPGIKTGKEYLLNLEMAMKRGTLPLEFADSMAEVAIGGKTFFRLDDTLHFSSADVHQAFFSTKLDKYILSFILTSRDPQVLEMLVGTLDSLLFEAASQ